MSNAMITELRTKNKYFAFFIVISRYYNSGSLEERVCKKSIRNKRKRAHYMVHIPVIDKNG